MFPPGDQQTDVYLAFNCRRPQGVVYYWPVPVNGRMKLSFKKVEKIKTKVYCRNTWFTIQFYVYLRENNSAHSFEELHNPQMKTRRNAQINLYKLPIDRC